MGYSVEVNRDSFRTEVLETSYIKPILVDFYAIWCGPCQLLKPVLEKLVQEYDFVLAKVDIDKNQELATQFGIEGVPDVRIVVRGEMYPGFVGAIQEAQLRDLLERLNLKSELELGLESVKSAIASQNLQQAKQLFDELFAKYPENSRIALEAARFLIRIGQLEDAQKMAKTIKESDREFYPRAQSLQTLIDFRQSVDARGEEELDRLFAQAAHLALAENYEGALQQFLNIVQENRQYKNDGARKAMVALFNLLGLDHPLTKQYQQELMTVLY